MTVVGSFSLCYGGIIFNNSRVLRSFQGIVTDSQWCTVQLINALLTKLRSEM